MHLDEERVQRLLHGELQGPEEAAAREHLTACAECRMLVDDALAGDEWVRGLLRHLDHPMPKISPAVIEARATRASESRLLLRAAGFLVALAVAGAAYAIPGSPLRSWVRAVVHSVGERRETPGVPSPASDSAVAGISVFPGEGLRILFTSRQVQGVVRIALTDGAEVVVRAPRGAATFTSASDQLLIDNRGSSATFEVQVPRAAPKIVIQVEGEEVFHQTGAGVTLGEGTGDGVHYVLPLGRRR